jgi:hypothetical protein
MMAIAQGAPSQIPGGFFSMYGNQLAKTGLGVSLFGTYLGEWKLVVLAIGLTLFGALAVRASRPFRRDAK